MAKYTITIKRTTYADFKVEANSLEEAKELALDKAYNTNFGGFEAEYDVEQAGETK